ncbi:MAG TPA: hypothetical protein VE964_08500 [Myxococcales bacterium]|nr:hypothetical protein [Myxococcales bacterium]
MLQPRTLSILAALALGAACSSSSKETRTASAQTTASQAANTPASERPSADSANVLPPTAGQAMPEPAPRMMGGQVVSVDPANRRLTVNQAGGGPNLVIVTSDDTDFVDANGQTLSEGLAGLHEGDQVRATFDPSSHKVDRVLVTKSTQPSR